MSSALERVNEVLGNSSLKKKDREYLMSLAYEGLEDEEWDLAVRECESE